MQNAKQPTAPEQSATEATQEQEIKTAPVPSGTTGLATDGLPNGTSENPVSDTACPQDTPAPSVDLADSQVPEAPPTDIENFNEAYDTEYAACFDGLFDENYEVLSDYVEKDRFRNFFEYSPDEPYLPLWEYTIERYGHHFEQIDNEIIKPLYVEIFDRFFEESRGKGVEGISQMIRPTMEEIVKEMIWECYNYTVMDDLICWESDNEHVPPPLRDRSRHYVYGPSDQARAEVRAGAEVRREASARDFHFTESDRPVTPVRRALPKIEFNKAAHRLNAQSEMEPVLLTDELLESEDFISRCKSADVILGFPRFHCDWHHIVHGKSIVEDMADGKDCGEVTVMKVIAGPECSLTSKLRNRLLYKQTV